MPLSSKEFTEGILRSVSADEINYFINQSWDPELILELVVGGIVCPDGNVVFNRGVPGAGGEYDAFAKMFANADRFPIQPVSKPSIKILRMSASEALSVMKDGVGNGRTVESIDPVIEKGKNTGSVDVTIASIGTEAFHGIRTLGVCSRVRNDRGERPLAPTQGILRLLQSTAKNRGRSFFVRLNRSSISLGKRSGADGAMDRCAMEPKSSRGPIIRGSAKSVASGARSTLVS